VSRRIGALGEQAAFLGVQPVFGDFLQARSLADAESAAASSANEDIRPKALTRF
jgi:hypothetical protein